MDFRSRNLGVGNPMGLTNVMNSKQIFGKVPTISIGKYMRVHVGIIMYLLPNRFFPKKLPRVLPWILARK